MKNILWVFARHEDGATMAEYSIMAALIAAVCVGAVQLIGGTTNNLFLSFNAVFPG